MPASEPPTESWCPEPDGDELHGVRLLFVAALLLVASRAHAQADTDSDGLDDMRELELGSDPADADSDDDGVVDGDELRLDEDTDGDGLPNVLDPDSDNDGLLDGTEQGVTLPSADTDLERFVPDADPLTTTDPLDSDTDGGGLVDGLEDIDQDGALDVGELDPLLTDDDEPERDLDGDGIIDALEGPLDLDSDGDINALDLDSDGDSIPDADEVGNVDFPFDSDEDGFPNFLDRDSDGDTIADGDEFGEDGDGDGIPDQIDLDSDGDTIADADEAGDADLDTPPVDHDQDGTASFRDLDSDGDNIPDAIENDEADLVVDTDADGIADFLDTDSDDDGILDEEEAGDTPGSPVDSDVDGMPDFQDFDSDGDGVPDGDEAGDRDLITPPVDSDGDSEPDYLDLDSDNDSVDDGVDLCRVVADPEQLDTDGGGEGDACDADLDGDSIDSDEDNCPNHANLDQRDSDGDGLGDACDPEDVDRDGFDDDLGVSGGGCSAAGDAPIGGLLLVVMLLLWRGFRWQLAAIVVLCSAGEASAQPFEPQDFSVEHFRLSFDREGILDVEWGRVIGHLQWQSAMWLSVADDPLVLNARDAAGDRNRRAPLVDHRISGGLGFAIGLWDTLQVGVELPWTYAQRRDDDFGEGLEGPLPSLPSAGAGDLRLAPKVLILNQDDHRLNLALMAGITVPMGPAKGYLREKRWTLVPEVVVSRSFGAFRAAINLGYRLRAESTLTDLEVDDEIYTHVGVAYRMHEVGAPLEIDLTTYLAFSSERPFQQANETPWETRLGVVVDAHEHVAPFVAAGVGLLRGYGAPDWRLVLGIRGGILREDLGPCPGEEEDFDGYQDDDGCPDLDNDHDGIADTEDSCPDQVEDFDDFEDQDGCPDEDNDGDSVLDNDDQCPLDPESVNGFEDEDGCPDEASDTDGDGVRDNDDGCSEDPEDVDGYEDDDGCPDLDNDADGIPDIEDLCPSESGPPGNRGCPDQDSDGDSIVDRLDSCPAEPGSAEHFGCATSTPVQLLDSRVQLSSPIAFRPRSERLVMRSRAVAQELAQVLTRHPQRLLVIHITGAQAALLERRAQRLHQILVGAGLEDSALRIDVSEDASPEGETLSMLLEWLEEPSEEDDEAIEDPLADEAPEESRIDEP